MANPSTLFLPTDTQVVLPNGTINPVWWRYFKSLQVSLTTVDLSSQVTGVLPVVNGGTGDTTAAVPAGNLTGTTLAASVVTSSLTSVGTLISLVVAGALTGMTDLYTANWTDYGATSTIVGWTSFTSKVIRYKSLGKLYYVAFDIAGTSNATNVTFTLPATSANTGASFDAALGFAVDNGTTFTTATRLDLAPNSATVSCFTNMSNGAWTNSGTKRVLGQFWYEAA